jgi:hypothetical protein
MRPRRPAPGLSSCSVEASVSAGPAEAVDRPPSVPCPAGNSPLLSGSKSTITCPSLRETIVASPAWTSRFDTAQNQMRADAHAHRHLWPQSNRWWFTATCSVPDATLHARCAPRSRAGSITRSPTSDSVSPSQGPGYDRRGRTGGVGDGRHRRRGVGKSAVPPSGDVRGVTSYILFPDRRQPNSAEGRSRAVWRRPRKSAGGGVETPPETRLMAQVLSEV